MTVFPHCILSGASNASNLSAAAGGSYSSDRTEQCRCHQAGLSASLSVHSHLLLPRRRCETAA